MAAFMDPNIHVSVSSKDSASKSFLKINTVLWYGWKILILGNFLNVVGILVR